MCRPRSSLLLVTLLLLAGLGGCSHPTALVKRHRQAESLLATDRRFAHLSIVVGARRAYAHYLAPRAVFYPEGAAPIKGRRAILAALPGHDTISLEWTPERSWVGRGGTTGMTEGIFEINIARGRAHAAQLRYGDYLALWILRGGHWRLKAIMQNLRPPL